MSRTARAKRWLRLHLTGNRQRYRNWLNRRARARGKTPLPDRVTRGAGSRVPGYRNRVNPATGRPRWTDRNREALDRWQASRSQSVAAVRERNQQHVRDLLADRQPQYARTLDRAVSDLSQRTGRSR
jgi:hypothetical protein